jgi:hypothetical protein
MNFDIENDLRNNLGREERFLWTGRPKTGIVFRMSDIFLIPFSLLWFGFALFWEYNALRTGISFFALFGLPFILIGLYISAGRFFMDALRRKNTTYGITDSRVIIRSGLRTKEIQSLNIRAISDISFKENADNSGTISFGPSDPRYRMVSGMGYWPGVKLPASLEMIEDVRKVYTILIGQQRKL